MVSILKRNLNLKNESSALVKILIVDVEWRISSTHDSGVKGPRLEPRPR